MNLEEWAPPLWTQTDLLGEGAAPLMVEYFAGLLDCLNWFTSLTWQTSGHRPGWQVGNSSTRKPGGWAWPERNLLPGGGKGELRNWTGNCLVERAVELMGNWLGHDWTHWEAARKPCLWAGPGEAGWGYPRNLLGEIHRGDEHTPQKQDQKAHRSQEERPVCPPGSLGALYWQSLTLRQLARERCFIITSREWRGDLGLKGNKFTNATAGNNCTWGGKLVYQAQMWKRNLHFTARLATVWFGRGALQNFFNALYWVSYCKIIMLLMIAVCQSSFQTL